MLIFQFDSDIALELFEYYLIPWSTKKNHIVIILLFYAKDLIITLNKSL